MGVFRKFTRNRSFPIVRLTKLADGVNPKYPTDHHRHIRAGLAAEGAMLRPVAVGESFYVDYPDKENHFHTSVVQEILSENTFRTQNSIYKWEIINK